MLGSSCHLALWTACWFVLAPESRSSGCQLGRSALKPCSPSGCPRAWRCRRQEVPSGAPPVLCECAPCAVSEETRFHTFVNENGVENVYFVTFKFVNLHFKPEPDARRRGNRIIVSISATVEQRNWKLQCGKWTFSGTSGTMRFKKQSHSKRGNESFVKEDIWE